MNGITDICRFLCEHGGMVLTVIGVWNLFVFFLYGVDKFRAKKQRYRIPEKVLLGSAAVLGSVGGLLGMTVFHHKTRKWYFVLLLPLYFLAHILLIGWTVRIGTL